MATAAANVQASDGTYSDKVQITWDAVTHATSYEVYRDAVKIGETTVTSYSDTSVVPNTTYAYTVKGCNASGCGPASVADTGNAYVYSCSAPNQTSIPQVEC